MRDIREKRIDIRAIHQPDFGDGDLAIVELEEPVSLDERAQLVKVSTERLKEGDLVLTLGWGLAFQRAEPDMLLKAQLRVSEVDRTGDLTFTEVGRNKLGIPIDPVPCSLPPTPVLPPPSLVPEPHTSVLLLRPASWQFAEDGTLNSYLGLGQPWIPAWCWMPGGGSLTPGFPTFPRQGSGQHQS